MIPSGRGQAVISRPQVGPGSAVGRVVNITATTDAARLSCSSVGTAPKSLFRQRKKSPSHRTATALFSRKNTRS
ncbi:hypothetical protein [Xenorhabdus miraniensis]|uniref:hypothetical protein n=1 Tax=Xenorhabdus miraniensis TaxID=351674 RepID=UPI0011AB3AD9|nr:hypothetical protein [Xenorhabdus miraniensis]